MDLFQYMSPIWVSRSYILDFDNDDIEFQYFKVLQTTQDWRRILEVFYNNSWFRRQLSFCARKAARKFFLGSDCCDDIQQEALLEFSSALRRNCSLGYSFSQGTVKGFISIILYRCCLKALQQFNYKKWAKTGMDSYHPSYDQQPHLERLMDVRIIVDKMQKPYQGIIRQLLAGETVIQIAKSRKRSKRTIYRWINHSVTLLKKLYFEE